MQHKVTLRTPTLPLKTLHTRSKGREHFTQNPTRQLDMTLIQGQRHLRGSDCWLGPYHFLKTLHSGCIVTVPDTVAIVLELGTCLYRPLFSLTLNPSNGGQRAIYQSLDITENSLVTLATAKGGSNEGSFSISVHLLPVRAISRG